MSILGSDTVTVNGNLVIPQGCVYVVALCSGNDGIDPPYLNGNMMQTKASVLQQGILPAISIHVSTFPEIGTLPFAMNGADVITWVYLDAAVCTRADVVQGYSASAGQITGNLTTSTNDLVLGIVIGSNGQVEIKGDTVDLTLIQDTLTRRVGSIVPGDTSLSCLATDNSTLSGYWYQPPAVWVNTTTTRLVRAAHYEWPLVVVTVTYQYDHHDTPWVYDFYRRYENGVYIGLAKYPKGQVPTTYNYNSYPPVWVPDQYETITTGYWDYPPQVWVETGVAGQVSAAWVSIADVMIGGTFVSRPIIC